MKLSLVSIVLLLSSWAQAEVIVTKTVNVPVDLSTAGIRLSKAGYRMPTVKILIPELAAHTVMNHRNEGETAPCVATIDALFVEEVVQGRPEVESVPFTITLEKNARIGTLVEPMTTGDLVEKKVCMVTLTERVEGVVRGFNFTHVRSSNLPSRHVDDCK